MVLTLDGAHFLRSFGAREELGSLPSSSKCRVSTNNLYWVKMVGFRDFSTLSVCIPQEQEWEI